MNWIEALYETYENNCAAVGELHGDAVPLLPVAHTTQKANVEIALDERGNFLGARVLGKEEARTIIPCTENSSNRTSGPVPHPLADKLQYVAADYAAFGGAKEPCFDAYRGQLERWCASEHAHWKARAVLDYIRKGSVVGDLVRAHALHADEQGRLLAKWDKAQGPAPAFFASYPAIDQSDAFVRWRVERPGEPDATTWADQTLYESWQQYYASTLSNKQLCYITGEEDFITEKHPFKIREDKDFAKLISSNNPNKFTFLGRFISTSEVCRVSFAVTNKAHSALRWLIARQGTMIDTEAFVAWTPSGAKMPDLMTDTLRFAEAYDEEGGEEEEEAPAAIYTAQDVANRFSLRMRGYHARLDDTSSVFVMAVDSATTGRLSITYFRELTGSDLLARIESWHATCRWKHDYAVVKDENRPKGIRSVPFVGEPSPKDIAEAAYGARAGATQKASTAQRLLACIVDGAPLPRDLVEAAVSRATRRAGREDWEWNKNLGIACALFNKWNGKGAEPMALDKTRATRDYLYGRLLAVADGIEGWALRGTGEQRQTNAARYTQRFAERPFSTWRQLSLALEPYRQRLGPQKLHKFDEAQSGIMNLFRPEDFTSDAKLSGEFLLGYWCQRAAFFESARPAESTDIENQEE